MANEMATHKRGLAVRELWAGYAGTDILRGISIDVPRGVCVALLGPNGVGKSTLLRVLSGQLRAWRGTITLDGAPAIRAGADQLARGGVRWTGEPKPIYPNLTVRENLEIGGLTVRARFDERFAAVHEMLPLLGSFGNARAGELSGGQQQILAIGQALMSDPKYLLLDEPSLGLAPAIVESLAEIIARLTGTGIGILWAEQFPRVAVAHAERVALLQRGQIVIATETVRLTTSDLERAYLG